MNNTSLHTVTITITYGLQQCRFRLSKLDIADIRRGTSLQAQACQGPEASRFFESGSKDFTVYVGRDPRRQLIVLDNKL